MVRRPAGHLQVSRLGIRAGLRTMPRNPFAYRTRFARSLPHLRHCIPLRRARWPRLGLCPTKWERKIAGRRSVATAARPRGSQIQPAIPFGVSDGRSALQHRSRHHRIDGSGARAFRSSGLVVAIARQHPRKGKTLRADRKRLSHDRASAVGQQRALQAAGRLRRADHHHHRFRSAQSALRNHSLRREMVCQPDHGDADHREPLPHRRVRGVERLSQRAVSYAYREILRATASCARISSP